MAVRNKDMLHGIPHRHLDDYLKYCFLHIKATRVCFRILGKHSYMMQNKNLIYRYSWQPRATTADVWLLSFPHFLLL